MVRGLLSTYFPPLPRSVLTLQAGGLINSFGNGMVIPVMFIYRLHAAADRAAGARTAAHAGPGALRPPLGWRVAPRNERRVVQPETAFAVLVVVMVVFAIGQCLHGAVAAPLATDLAEPRLMGRYMALNALSWQIGFALGPALGGAGLAVSPNGLDSGRLAVRDRGGVHAGRGGRASDSSASHTDTGSGLGLSRQAPGLQSRTWR